MIKITSRVGLALALALLSLSAFVSSASAAANTAVVDAARAAATDQRDTMEAVLPYIVVVLAASLAVAVLFWAFRKSKSALR
ncbi:MAG: hypothetical protein ACJ76L_15345 [Conexibacter sp.]